MTHAPREGGVMMVRSRDDIYRMAELKGKKIGLSKSQNKVKTDWWGIQGEQGIELMLRVNGMTRADVQIVEFPYPDDWYDKPEMMGPEMENPSELWLRRDHKHDLAFRPLETALEEGVIDAMYMQSGPLSQLSETTGKFKSIEDLSRYPDWTLQVANIPAMPPDTAMMQVVMRPAWVAALFVLLPLLAARPARAAEEATEVWPELNLFKKTSATTRLYFVAAYAENKDSQLGTLDLAGYFDLTLKPILRPSLRAQNWQGRRYFWIRLGYDHVFKTEDRDSKETSEHRGIVAVHGRTWLPGQILVEGRLRADLRWIGSEYSTRYRGRLEVNRDFEVTGRTVTPYLQIEPFYDTRYDDWSRVLYQLGAEIQVRKLLHSDKGRDFRVEWQNRAHFRLEPYVALQVDWRPEHAVVTAFGIVARWYF